ncbi:helix-turn-helix and ligand-binding sensor domain-containing protein [Flavobacterium rhizosphaerae]|uniref:Triple tyrosine motif-containing protein n=1 Tax=Flavobacterium rhizosphaerae TaxID=3163298 RepID=A0ABW8Z0S5_9FLAO
MNRIVYFIILLYNITFTVFSQVNTVKIEVYKKKDFNADAQFWTASENTDGILFFGNNDGVLIYDGEHWKKITLPNSSSVRSLAKGKNGIMYVGGYNEAGTIQQDKNGEYIYTSNIKNLKLSGKNIENIWDIELIANRTLYRAYSEIIVASGNAATHIPTTTSFIFSEKIGADYYVQESGNGVLKLNQNGEFGLVLPAKEFNNGEIVALLPGNSKDIVTVITTNGMVYTCNFNTGKTVAVTNIFDGQPTDEISSAIRRPDGKILLGTVASKIIILHPNGVVEVSPEIFSELEQNVIHNLYQASDKNLWVLQNNGLAYIDYQSPYVALFNRASVYDVLIHKQTIYLATAQGVYYAPFTTNKVPLNGDFKKIEGLQGQSWSVQLLDGDIIVSHDSGLYRLTGTTPVAIGNVSGFWKVTPDKNKQGDYLASHYGGLYLLQKKDNEWLLRNKIVGFDESARDIMPDNEPGYYWVCHGYQGVFRLHINTDYNRVISVDHFTDKNGLENAYNINVSQWVGQIIFTTNSGIYTYNKKDNHFYPHNKLNTILDPEKNTRKIFEYGNKTWFVHDDEAGYFYTAEKDPELVKDPFLNLKGTFNRGMECLTGFGPDKMLFGTSNGLFLYNIHVPKQAQAINTLLTEVSYANSKETSLMPVTGSDGQPHVLPNQTSIVRFDFTAPKMPHGTQVQYSYILQNTDDKWSAWQPVPYKEYTHLPPGEYTFKVKSRNTAGIQGKPFEYSFIIRPKWYQTTLAYIIYCIAGLALIAAIRLLIKMRIRHERNKSRREAEQAKKLLELELEQLKLQRDKEAMYRDKAVLEEDVINKSKELANYTMMLLQKKEFFSEITSDLKELKDYVRNENSRKKLLDIFRKLNQHKIGEEYMEVFDVNFEKVHHNFFEGLKALNPTLTKRELRLCAFVKMNLSNKEIAPLLGISLRGVENARYRIRKKLNVSTDENFAAFLEHVDKETETT